MSDDAEQAERRSESEAKERPGMANDTPKLTKIVERIRKLNAEIKEARFEIKELADGAWESCGYSAKAVKALAKEAAWNEVEREARRQLEEEIDRGRVALGMLADTPLGQAEMERMERECEASIKSTARRGKGKSKRNGQQAAAGA